jgi:hypothetical protein
MEEPLVDKTLRSSMSDGSDLRIFLTKLRQEQHFAVLQKNELPPDVLADCDTSELTALGLPLGAAKAIIRAAKGKVSSLPRRAQHYAPVAAAVGLRTCSVPRCNREAEKECRLADDTDTCGKSFCEAHVEYVKHVYPDPRRPNVDGYQCGDCKASEAADPKHARGRFFNRVMWVFCIVFTAFFVFLMAGGFS